MGAQYVVRWERNKGRPMLWVATRDGCVVGRFATVGGAERAMWAHARRERMM